MQRGPVCFDNCETELGRVEAQVSRGMWTNTWKAAEQRKAKGWRILVWWRAAAWCVGGQLLNLQW